MKLLCVAFDLAILSTYNKESYFRCVYHDDVLSQQDNGIKTRLLVLIDELTKKYQIQYIFSIIKSDLPIDQEEKTIEFSDFTIKIQLELYLVLTSRFFSNLTLKYNYLIFMLNFDLHIV